MMIKTMWQDYKKAFFGKFPRLQRERSISLGQGIRRIARLKHMKRVELATRLKCDIGVVTRLCGSYQYTTTWKQLVEYAEALDVAPEELIRRSREEFYGNFFITKSKVDPKEALQYKKEGLALFEVLTLDYKDYYVIPHTPAIESPFDFFVATVGIKGGKAISEISLAHKAEVFVTPFQGGVEIASGKFKEEVVPGTSVTVKTSHPVTIRNLSDSRTTEILIAIFPINEVDSKKERKHVGKQKENADVYELLKLSKEWLAPDPETPFSITQLSRLLGLKFTSLNYIDQGKAVNLPLEELERFSIALQYPFENFLTTNDSKNTFSRFSATKSNDRYEIRLKPEKGVKIQTLVSSAKDKRSFFAGELFLDEMEREQPGFPIQLKHWSDQFEGFVWMMVLDGKPGLVVGKDRHYPNLQRGETVYFNARLGFDLSNLESTGQTKLLFLTFPSIL